MTHHEAISRIMWFHGKQERTKDPSRSNRIFCRPPATASVTSHRPSLEGWGCDVPYLRLRVTVSFVSFAARVAVETKLAIPRLNSASRSGPFSKISPITLDKWLLAMWMLANCKIGVSVLRDFAGHWDHSEVLLGLLLQRIRLALQDENAGKKLAGEKLKQTRLSSAAKSRNMHREEGASGSSLGTGGKDKTTGRDWFSAAERSAPWSWHSQEERTPEKNIRDHVESRFAVSTPTP